MTILSLPASGLCPCPVGSAAWGPAAHLCDALSDGAHCRVHKVAKAGHLAHAAAFRGAALSTAHAHVVEALNFRDCRLRDLACDGRSSAAIINNNSIEAWPSLHPARSFYRSRSRHLWCCGSRAALQLQRCQGRGVGHLQGYRLSQNQILQRLEVAS